MFVVQKMKVLEATVDTEKIDTGRNVLDLKAIWRVCLETLPLQNSKETRSKNEEKAKHS